MTWWIAHYKKKKEKEKEEREEREPTPQELLQREAELKIEDAYQTLIKKADEAVEYLRRRKEEVENPGIRKMIEKIEYHWRVMRPKNKVEPGVAIAALALRDALTRGLHETPEGREKIYQYMIKRAYESSKQLARSIKPHHNMNHVKETITNPMEVLYQVRSVIYQAEGTDETATKYYNILTHVLETSYKELKDRGLDLSGDKGERILGHLHHEEVEEKIDGWFRRLEEEGTIPRFWHQTPEQILGIEKKEEEGETGAGTRILRDPERYLSITTKLYTLLKTLEWRTGAGGEVPRTIYKALRNMLETPLLTGNYPGIINRLIEGYEGGEGASPLQAVLEALAPHIPEAQRILEEEKSILQKINTGQPLTDEEKKRLAESIERIQSWIASNKEKEALTRAYHDLVLSHTTPPAEKMAQTIDGILEDLKQIHTGAKTRRDLDRERDIVQFIRFYNELRNIKEKMPLTPGVLAENLWSLVNNYVQDEEMRKMYKTAIQHYLDTHHSITRSPDRFLEQLEQREEELLQKLEKEHPEASERAKATARDLYRILVLSSVRPTIRETLSFYNQVKERLKLKTPLGEYLPQHGPITSDLTAIHERIAGLQGEERREMARRFGTLASAGIGVTQTAKEEVRQLLALNQGERLPRREHEKFLKRLEYHQVRR